MSKYKSPIKDPHRAAVLLRKAIDEYLWDGHGEYPYRANKEEYLCHAVWCASTRLGPKYHITHAQLRQYIFDALGCASYRTWVQRQGFTHDSKPGMQAGRRAWAQWMIKELEARA